MMSPIVPSSPTETPRRFHWRRLFQYRLRTILILTTIIAVWLGWWSYKAAQQREAVAELSRLGAIVRYDIRYWPYDEKGAIHEWDNDFDERQRKNSIWNYWVFDGRFLDYLANVKSVVIPSGTEITDAELEHIKALTNLEILVLHGTQVTDDGVARLQKALPNCKIER